MVKVRSLLLCSATTSYPCVWNACLSSRALPRCASSSIVWKHEWLTTWRRCCRGCPLPVS